MNKKQINAIKLMYNDGLVLKEMSSVTVPTYQKKYYINGMLHTSHTVGTFDQDGSFICTGLYAIMTNTREAYDKFFEIAESDTKNYKEKHDCDSVYKHMKSEWKEYLNGSHGKDKSEGMLDKDWKKHTAWNHCLGTDTEVYMLGSVMINKYNLDHLLRFMHGNINYVAKGQLDPVFICDNETVGIVMPIRYDPKNIRQNKGE